MQEWSVDGKVQYDGDGMGTISISMQVFSLLFSFALVKLVFFMATYSTVGLHSLSFVSIVLMGQFLPHSTKFIHSKLLTLVLKLASDTNVQFPFFPRSLCLTGRGWPSQEQGPAAVLQCMWHPLPRYYHRTCPHHCYYCSSFKDFVPITMVSLHSILAAALCKRHSS